MKSEIQERAEFSEVRYGQCWEDADILVEALKVHEERKCLSIGSAGDNSFALLAAGASHVTAVEMNPAQVACIERRKNAYLNLDYDDFLREVSSSTGKFEDYFRLFRTRVLPLAHSKKRIRELLEIQGDRCAITGISFQFQGAHEDTNMLPSLDRIDSNGHYEGTNVQLVCRFINFWKQAADDEEFRRLIMIVRGENSTS